MSTSSSMSTPSERSFASRRAASAGSSRVSTPGPFCSTVTGTPSRVRPCASSIAIGPAPIMTRLAGARSSSKIRSLVRKPGVREADDRRRERPAAGRQQDEARLVLVVADRDRRRRGQPRGAEQHIDALGAEAVGVVVGARELLLDRVDARPHARRVDDRLDRRQPVAVGVAHRVRRLGRGQQSLGRHAARPQAVAADAVALDAGDLDRRASARTRRRPCPPSPCRR